MKKFFALVLTAVMVLTMAVNAFAAKGGFVKSPSENPAPEVIYFNPNVDGCDAKLVVTPYVQRKTLSADLKDLIEKAYKIIANSDDLTKLNSDFANLVASKNIAPENLAVSDLFDAHIEGCLIHDYHVGSEVILKADTLDKFVGLLHMTADGEWELIKNAEVINNGECLKFSCDSFSPFAIVVELEGEEPNPPATGDRSKMHVYIIVMAVSAFAAGVIIVKSKKQRA